VKFGYKQEANCIYCYEPQQTIEHLYTECGRTQILFKNFEKHFKLDTELSCLYIAHTYHSAAAAVHRLGGLAHLAAPLLHSRILLPATQPKRLHWQQPGQEVEKREQLPSYLP
jgi:hypothetical protein